MKYLFAPFLLLSLLACTLEKTETTASTSSAAPQEETTTTNSTPDATVIIDTSDHLLYAWTKVNPKDALVNRIAPPRGFHRMKVTQGSYADWLRHLPLQAADAPVLLFDGRQKGRQDVHAAVVDIDIGKRNLQQCADAVMRLRAEYLYSQKAYADIHFNYTSGDRVAFDDWRQGRKPKVQGNRVLFTAKTGTANNSYANFKSYLIQIFNYAGTASLSKELPKVDLETMQIGDVLIQGGFPGHAVQVVDMVTNEGGEQLYLLAQSYMPAQNIHILKNHSDPNLSPWYRLEAGKMIHTPEWTFGPNDLHRFQ